MLPEELLKIGRNTLDNQPFSRFLGAELIAFEPGKAILELPIRAEFFQHQGIVHGGVVSYLIDNAITFAGASVLGASVVTAEFKVNYTRPARGQKLVATATVESSGRSLAVCRCVVTAIDGEKTRTCAIGQGTISVLPAQNVNAGD